MCLQRPVHHRQYRVASQKLPVERDLVLPRKNLADHNPSSYEHKEVPRSDLLELSSRRRGVRSEVGRVWFRLTAGVSTSGQHRQTRNQKSEGVTGGVRRRAHPKRTHLTILPFSATDAPVRLQRGLGGTASPSSSRPGGRSRCHYFHNRVRAIPPDGHSYPVIHVHTPCPRFDHELHGGSRTQFINEWIISIHENPLHACRSPRLQAFRPWVRAIATYWWA